MAGAAIYYRVSTVDQSVDGQIAELREYADKRGFEIADEYVDHCSGAARQRPELDRMMGDVRQRKADVVLVWAFDRFARLPRDVNLSGVLSMEKTKRALSLAGERAEIGHVTPHMLRHTFATMALDAGAELYDVQAALGHKTPHMTMRYDHGRPERAQRVTEAIKRMRQA